MKESSARRTLIVLGSGASWPLPQTHQLTQGLLSLDFQWPGFMLYDHVHRLTGGTFNFEDIIAALWDLALALQHHEAPPKWAVRLAKHFLKNQDLRGIAAPGAAVAARRIASQLSNAPKPGVSHQGKVCGTLASNGPTVVATLNYDDSLLASFGTFYDGFHHGQGTSDFDDQFSERAWQRQNVSLWLHGSVHFNIHGHSPVPHPQAGRIFWEDTPSVNWSGAVRNDLLDIPLVIGSDKPRQILRPPFIHYWSALSAFAGTVDRLLVIGYGGNDPHLNHVLQNIVLWHGNQLRLVICTSVHQWTAALPTLFKLFPGLFNAYVLPFTRAAVPGGSLQKILAPKVPNWPEIWMDLDGVQDLAKAKVLKQLVSITHGP